MPKNRQIPIGKKIYFASDFHFGAADTDQSPMREKRVIRWLDSIKHDAEIIFLVGDLFDFWFEYRQVVPRGFTRFLGKLAELSDAGIELVVFKGNHDMWMNDYFEKELNIKTFRQVQSYIFNDKAFLIGHGDGLGPGDFFYKNILKSFFEGWLPTRLFGRVLHPNLGIYLGKKWANHSWQRHQNIDDVYHFYGEDKEILYLYCQEQEAISHHDYYIFGHRHLKLDLKVGATARYINLGDWIRFNSYAVFDGLHLEMHTFEG